MKNLGLLPTLINASEILGEFSAHTALLRDCEWLAVILNIQVCVE